MFFKGNTILCGHSVHDMNKHNSFIGSEPVDKTTFSSLPWFVREVT